MLEQPVVGWQLEWRPDWPTRIYIWYVVVAGLLALKWVVRICRHIGLSSWRTRRALERLADSWRSRSVSAVSELSLKFSPKSPEAGLREWSSLRPGEDWATFLRVLDDAESQFAYVLRRMHGLVGRFQSLIWLTVLVSALWSMSRASQAFSYLVEWKGQHVVVVYGLMGEMVWGLLFGGWLLLVLFLLREHFRGRLARRQDEWDYFRGRVKHFARTRPEDHQSEGSHLS